MKPGLLLLLAVAASACERDPMARTDDLWPRFHRAAATAFPTAEEIELACGEASLRFKQEAEQTPGTYVDLDFADFPARRPQCRWEEGSASTAVCRFERVVIPWGAESDKPRRAWLAALKDRDWEPHRVRMVRVRGPSDSRWIAPAGCQRLPEQ